MSILLLIFIGSIIFIIVVRNSLVTKQIRVKEAWSDIDVQLKRRYDLIPNLINTVKGYAAHETELFEKVTAMRSQAMQAQDIGEKMKLEDQLNQELKSIFVAVENYPELKANENFLKLQNDLVDTEDKIQAARRFYNSVVKDYNTALELFPQNLIAQMFHYQPEKLIEIQNNEEREPVKVEF